VCHFSEQPEGCLIGAAFFNFSSPMTRRVQKATRRVTRKQIRRVFLPVGLKYLSTKRKGVAILDDF